MRKVGEMLTVDVITIFPETITPYLQAGMIRKARENDILKVRVHNLRGYSDDPHNAVDDYPYGGGPGMVLKPEPVFAAVEAIETEYDVGLTRKIILPTPQGRLFTQRHAESLARKKQLIFVCGRYEGVDERVRRHLVDAEYSIGDYVLTGGELPALVMIDAVSRLLPGVLGSEAGVKEDSHTQGLLEGPQYTRPRSFNGWEVPKILLSGDHGAVAAWRKKQSLKRTLMRRPDLLRDRHLTLREKKLLREVRDELKNED